MPLTLRLQCGQRPPMISVPGLVCRHDVTLNGTFLWHGKQYAVASAVGFGSLTVDGEGAAALVGDGVLLRVVGGAGLAGDGVRDETRIGEPTPPPPSTAASNGVASSANSKYDPLSDCRNKLNAILPFALFTRPPFSVASCHMLRKIYFLCVHSLLVYGNPGKSILGCGDV